MVTNRSPYLTTRTSGGIGPEFHVDLSFAPGNVFFVNSQHNNASDAPGHGQTPDQPFATIDYAVGQCTASGGDLILVMPGHTEELDAAADIDLDVAGVKILGLGWGDTRPRITYSAAAGTFEINADDCWIENLIFEGQFTNGVTKAVDILTGADDTTIKNCVFRGAASTQELLIAINIEATISRVNIIGCEFYEVTGGDATGAITTEGAITDLRVQNCFFSGDWSAAVLDLDAGTDAIVRAHILDNIAYNADTSAGLFASIDSGSVCIFIGNRTGIGKANTIPVTDLSASVCIENYATDGAGISSLEWPATATAWA